MKPINSDYKNIIRGASVYTGIIIGAGFASGQELHLYFTGFGRSGFIGLLISGLLFSLVGWAVMDLCVKNNIKSYKAFLNFLFGEKLGYLVNYASIVFLYILFCAMLSGASTLADESFGINYTIAVIVISLLCLFTFLFDLSGIIKINTILVPMLIVIGIFLGLYTYFTDTAEVFVSSEKKNFGYSAIIYSAYNIVTAVSVLSAIPEIIHTKKIAKYTGILGGICLTLLGISFSLPLFSNSELAGRTAMPMLAIASQSGIVIKAIYILILFIAIYTTAITNGFAILRQFKMNKNQLLIKILLVAFAALFAHIGFANFVGVVYPIFAYLGLFEILVILFTFFTSH